MKQVSMKAADEGNKAKCFTRNIGEPILSHCLPSRFIFLVGILLLLELVGCGRPEKQEEEPPPASVQALHAWKEPLDEWLEFPGTTQPLPNHQAFVTAAVGGPVESILPGAKKGQGKATEEGQRVESNQVIAKLDDHIARANLAKAEAALKDLEAQKKQTDTALELTQNNFDRLESLKNSGGKSGTELVSGPELERARGALHDAQAQQQAALAKEASGRAEVQSLKEQLDYYAMKAPISGWLGIVQVAPGQTISVGTTVAEIVDLDEIDVLCFIPPSRVNKLALNQPARLVMDDTSSPDEAPAATGKVVFIARQGQTDTGSIAVKVRFPNQKVQLRANSLVRVQIQTQPLKERWVIPTRALIEDQDPPGVVVVEDLKTEKDEKVGKSHILQAVQGVRNEQRHLVEILRLDNPPDQEKKLVSGIEETLFVVDGGNGLKDDDEVKVEEVPHEEEKPEGKRDEKGEREKPEPKKSNPPQEEQ